MFRLLLLSFVALPCAFAQDASASDDADAVADVPALPSAWSVDSRASDVYVVIRNDPDASLARLGHDHVIYASTLSGSIQWPASGEGACRVEIQVPVQQLVVDPPGLRERAGLDDNTIDDGQKDKLKQNMWGRSQLDADSHPNVTFLAEDCPGGTGSVPVDGTITIRGVSKPLKVTMNVTVSDRSFRARGSFTTSHEAHGFKPFQATLFGPRNAQPLAFSLDVRATPTGD